MASGSYQPQGLEVIIDKVVYQYLPEDKAPPQQRHMFVYYITIHNGSKETVQLLARKWVIDYPEGTREVIEGDKIVGHEPYLQPCERFSYNSFHLTDRDCMAQGSFHGVNKTGHHIFVPIPLMRLELPREALS